MIVGASLAGLRAAITLRGAGFDGPLTVVGDEADLPYERPPLTKQVLAGWVPPDHTFLPWIGSLTNVRLTSWAGTVRTRMAPCCRAWPTTTTMT